MFIMIYWILIWNILLSRQNIATKMRLGCVLVFLAEFCYYDKLINGKF